MLVDVFSGELRRLEHLKEFYLILPALSMSAVEFILHSKEKLTKRGKDSLTVSPLKVKARGRVISLNIETELPSDE